MTKQHTGPQAAALHTVHSKGRPVVSLGCLLQPACWEQFTHGIKQRSMLPSTAVQHYPGQPFCQLCFTQRPAEAYLLNVTFLPAVFHAQHHAEAYLVLLLRVGYWAVIYPGNVLRTALSRGLSFTASLGWPVHLFCQQCFTHNVKLRLTFCWRSGLSWAAFLSAICDSLCMTLCSLASTASTFVWSSSESLLFSAATAPWKHKSH